MLKINIRFIVTFHFINAVYFYLAVLSASGHYNTFSMALRFLKQAFFSHLHTHLTYKRSLLCEF